jgi:hypothetical protein
VIEYFTAARSAGLRLACVEAIRAEVQPAVEQTCVAGFGRPVAKQRCFAVDRKPARQDHLDVRLARCRQAAGDVAHHLGIRVQLDQPVGILDCELPESQPRRL